MSASTSVAPACCIENNVNSNTNDNHEVNHTDVEVVVEDAPDFQVSSQC